MSSYSLPSDSLQRSVVLGERIRLARTRRGWTGAELAERAGVGRNTVSALERGRPGTAIGVYLSVLWALGLEKSLDGVADPELDTHGKVLEAARRPQRVRTARRTDIYDF
ncbi:helix-turn-helix transcriptional regulator [Xanthomonas campestris]|uniref:helix-turn-helix transcriptional regulator n=1 Tax=Xanthomonas campestris TaxID=339 RepID=UPI00096D9FDB|nr:helix-turn-helix domain-containing protein [Xanthomonas campestris pv. raphani]WDJ17308.1 helix-turn-helix domain-containing protein [Xanthomonas campestris pv. raphani]